MEYGRESWVVARAVSSMHRAGWPHAYDLFDNDADQIVYRNTMKDLASFYLELGKVDLLFKIGPLAKDNLPQALYILGYINEPPGDTADHLAS